MPVVLFIHFLIVTLKTQPSPHPKYNYSPLTVPRSALWPNALMIQPYSTPAQGLLGPPWQSSALSPGIFWNNGPMGGSQWGEGPSENPVPVCTQLSLGTVELLNWRKIALYPGLSACAHPLPPALHAWPQLTSNLSNQNDKMAQQ